MQSLPSFQLPGKPPNLSRFLIMHHSRTPSWLSNIKWTGPNVLVERANMANLAMTDQVRLASQMTGLIGVAGAGFVHQLFLAPFSALLVVFVPYQGACAIQVWHSGVAQFLEHAAQTGRCCDRWCHGPASAARGTARGRGPPPLARRATVQAPGVRGHTGGRQTTGCNGYALRTHHPNGEPSSGIWVEHSPDHVHLPVRIAIHRLRWLCRMCGLCTAMREGLGGSRHGHG